MELSVDEIARRTGGTIVGDGAVRITGVAGLREARRGDLSFLGDSKYARHFETTKAAAILVRPEYNDHPHAALIQVERPYDAFIQLLTALETELLLHPEGIHPAATVATDAVVGESAAVGAHAVVESGARVGTGAVLYSGVYVGRDATVGPETIVYPNAVIRERCEVGAGCIVHPNVSIGGDGFGFTTIDGKHLKIPQVGNVVVGDRVEIGANTSVDRATAGSTRIGSGTKIDSQVQIGHNTQIGDDCIICGCCGIAGSAVIGNRVTIGAVSAVGGHLEIGDDAIIGGRSGVAASVAPGDVVSGFPAAPHKKVTKYLVSRLRLPEALRRLRQLEKRVDKLEE